MPTPTRRGWCTFQNTSASASRSGSAGWRPSGSRLKPRASSSVKRDEEGVDRQQQLVGAARHDHGAASSARAAHGAGSARRSCRRRELALGALRGRRRRRLRAAAASAAPAARAPARGARRRAAPSGASVMRAKPASARRSTPRHRGHRQARRVDAVDAAGVQQVAHLHVGVAGDEAQLHRAARARRRRRPRCAAGCGC